jgi:ankyrin repeat protein
MELLLSRGADPRRLNSQGWSPVTCVAIFRRFEAVDRLLAAGGDIDRPSATYLAMRRFPDGATGVAFQAAVAELTERCGGPARSQHHQELSPSAKCHGLAEMDQRRFVLEMSRCDPLAKQPARGEREAVIVV